MPKFEITLDGVKTSNYTYTTIIEAKDADDAWSRAEEIEPTQKDWVFAGFEDQTDNEIECDGVTDVVEVDAVEETAGSITYDYKKKLEA